MCAIGCHLRAFGAQGTGPSQLPAILFAAISSADSSADEHPMVIIKEGIF